MNLSQSGTFRLTGSAYTNGVLTVIAACLCVVALDTSTQNASMVSVAQAQPAPDDDVSGRISAAEQRKQIISEIRNTNVRLDKIEAMLSRGLSVKVTEMPRVKEAEKE